MLKRVSKTRILGVAAVLLVLAAGYLGWRWLTSGPRFFHHYNRIQPGLTLQGVTDIFGRPPDYSCLIHTGVVAYWSRDRLYVNPTTLPKDVSTASNLPYLYSSAQILFDRAGKVAAFTWNGEEIAIHTAEGDFPGSALNKLDDATVKRLIAG